MVVDKARDYFTGLYFHPVDDVTVNYFGKDRLCKKVAKNFSYAG
jgi:hypothetical protein